MPKNSPTTLNPTQVENALTYMRDQWPIPMSMEETEHYTLVFAKLYPGELVSILQRLPEDPRPGPEAILDSALAHRVVHKPPTAEFIRSVIDQARADLARAG